MRERLAWLVGRIDAAAARRGAGGPPELVAVLAALRADHRASAGEPDGARLTQLAEVFGLSSLERDLLVVAGGADMDANVARAYALLQASSSGRPSAGLALELCGQPSLSAAARAALGPASPLVSAALLAVEGDGPWLGRRLRAADRVVAYLLGDDAADPVTVQMLAPVAGAPVAQSVELARGLEHGVPLCWVAGQAGTAGLSAAAGAFQQLGVPYLAVDLARRPADVELAAAVRTVLRDAALIGAGLLLAGADALVEDRRAPLMSELERAPVPVIALGRAPWDPAWLRAMPLVLDAPALTPEARAHVWQRELPLLAEVATAAEWRDLVGLRLSPEEIVQAVRYAGELAHAKGVPLGTDVVREAVRRLGGAALPGRPASRTPPTFEDLVLPPSTTGSLRDLVSWARHRDEVLSHGLLAGAGAGGRGRGITALFAGSPGTGKTLAASVIAGALALELYTVELATVVDKYIGETEKNLEKIFREAEALNVVLFFDEADSLFGSRSEVRDARDRYANLEVAYLLQRMEQFDGIAILATNLRGNLDPAFSRRLHFIVHFPDPDLPTRRRLWESHLGSLPGLDAADPVDLDLLAAEVQVAGGDIRNIVLAAAYAATAAGVPVGMRHLLAATSREYRKLGRRPPELAENALDLGAVAAAASPVRR